MWMVRHVEATRAPYHAAAGWSSKMIFCCPLLRGNLQKPARRPLVDFSYFWGNWGRLNSGIFWKPVLLTFRICRWNVLTSIWTFLAIFQSRGFVDVPQNDALSPNASQDCITYNYIILLVLILYHISIVLSVLYIWNIFIVHQHWTILIVSFIQLSSCTTQPGIVVGSISMFLQVLYKTSQFFGFHGKLGSESLLKVHVI